MKRMEKELSQQSAIVYYRAVNIKGTTRSWCIYGYGLIRYSQSSFPLIALTSLFHVVPMVISPL